MGCHAYDDDWMCWSANADQVGDWGLARSFHDNQRHHTPTVITLWYRPPEVLLRTTRVSTVVFNFRCAHIACWEFWFIILGSQPSANVPREFWCGGLRVFI